MKKERGVKRQESTSRKQERGASKQKTFAIALLIIGAVLLCWSAYKIYDGLSGIDAVFAVTRGEGPLVPYLNYIQGQADSAIEKEEAVILYSQRMYDGLYFETIIYFQLLFFSLTLIAIGIMCFIWDASDKAKK